MLIIYQSTCHRRESEEIQRLTNTSVPHACAEDHAEKHVPPDTLIHSLYDCSVDFGFT